MAKAKKYSSDRGSATLKFLDRYLGIALIAIFGLFKTKRKFPTSIKKIGVLKTAAIGDTVLISAAIEDLKAHYPNAEILFFVGESNYGIAKLIGLNCLKISIKNPISSVIAFRKHQFDLFIDFGSWPRIDALLAGFSGAKWVIGYKTENQFRHNLFDQVVIHSQQLHELDNYGNLLRSLNIPVTHKPSFNPFPTPPAKNNQVTFHLFPGGSQAALKMWPEERWVEVANYLTEHGIGVVITGAKADKTKAEELAKKIKLHSLVRVVAGCSLLDTAWELCKSDVVITVDTGIMHLAAALHCQIISLHGPVNPKRWGPVSDTAIRLEPGNQCKRCVNLGFEPCSLERQCIDEIQVSQVIKALEHFLEYQLKKNLGQNA